MYAILDAILVLGFAYQIYLKSKAEGTWSNRVFGGTLLGAFVAAAALIGAFAIIVNGPRGALGPALLSVLVAYLTLFAAVIVWSSKTYKREMSLRRRGAIR